MIRHFKRNMESNGYFCLITHYFIKIYYNMFKQVFSFNMFKFTMLTSLVILLMLVYYFYLELERIDKPLQQNLYPVIMWWTKGFSGPSGLRQCPNGIKCEFISERNTSKLHNVNAYAFYGSNIKFNDLPTPRRPKDVIWALYHEESPRNTEELVHEEALSLFNLSATFSRHSDVPFPLQFLGSLNEIINPKYYVTTKVKNSLLKDLAPVLYLQSDCETATERDAYVEELMKYMKIDSYGTCLNNKKLPDQFLTDYLNNLNKEEFLKFVARYKFVIAIENGICHDYITEKFWRAIKVGSVPIYFGSPTVKDWYPNNKSAILLQDYRTPYLMSEYIKYLNNNDSLYEEYLEHKIHQVITNRNLVKVYKTQPYQTNLVQTVEKFECLICNKLHSKTGGKVVNKKHYDCPQPISALSLEVNPLNHWVYTWEMAKQHAKEIYNKVISKHWLDF